MISCAILAIGSELMEGSVVDTNSTFLSGRLSKLGFKVDYIRQLPDDKLLLIDVIKEVMQKYKLVLTTGGLGPTFDDMTAEVVAKANDRKLIHNDIAYQNMFDRLTRLNVAINEGHNRQVMLADGAILFDNHYGTAVGFGVDNGSSIIISMPGVPFEMKAMFDNYILPFIVKKFNPYKIFFKDIIFANISESSIDDEIGKMKISSDIQAIINAGKGLVVVKLRGYDNSKITKYATHLQEVFSDNFVGFDNYSLESLLYNLCIKYKKTIAFAESCTGGLLSSLITEIPGSSEIFLGSVITYSNDAKIQFIDVSKNNLDTFGAVSQEVAYDMVTGVKSKFRSNYAISITGIAGPAGATDTKKVGLVYLGLATDKQTKVVRLDLSGDRNAIRLKASNTAMFKLIEMIKDENR